MKTIVHVIDTTGPGGAETVFIDLADRLREHGYRSIPVIRGPGWVHDELQCRGLEPVVIDAKGSFNLPYLRALIRLIKTERADLVQSHLLGSNVYCALAGWLTGVPVVGTFHGMVDIHPDERFRSLKLWVMKRGLKRTVCVSRRLAEAIEAAGLLDPSRNTVIYNGINTARYGGDRSGHLRKELGLPEQATVAVSIGNVRPAKAYDVLVDAVGLLRDEYPNLHFVVAGDRKPRLMAGLTEQMQRLGVEDRMHFIGFVDDTVRLLGDADLFVLCSSSEGFSISTIEAMAAGVPVLVTRCGGPEEIVTHGQDGTMVEPGSPATLADAIRHLLADRDYMARLAEAARAKAQKRFDLAKTLETYQQTYRELASR